MKIAAYVRVSTKDQNTGMQCEELQKFCTYKWPDICPVFFVDHGESGAKTSRPALNAMLALARKKEIDMVITWKFDRIGRSSIHLITIMDELKELNIDFISIKENIDTTTPMGRMIFTIFAALAEFERETIRMRTKTGQDLAKSRGVHVGRKSQIPIETIKDILYLKSQGHTIDSIAMIHPRLSRATIGRIVRKGVSNE